jgi:hypothetical protein
MVKILYKMSSVISQALEQKRQKLNILSKEGYFLFRIVKYRGSANQ